MGAVLSWHLLQSRANKPATNGEFRSTADDRDRVMYCPVTDPNEKHTVLIVDSESNVKMGIINEHTPLAQALLGLSPGDVGDLMISGQMARQLRLLKIQRQGELLL